MVLSIPKNQASLGECTRDAGQIRRFLNANAKRKGSLARTGCVVNTLQTKGEYFINIHDPVEYKNNPLGKAWLELPVTVEASDASAVTLALFSLAHQISQSYCEIPRIIVVERLENGNVRLHMPLVEPEL